jgi:glucokinase
VVRPAADLTALPGPRIVAVDLGGSSVRAAGASRSVADPARRAVSAGMSRAELLDVIVAVVHEAAGDTAEPALGRVVAAVPSYVLGDGSLAATPSLPALEGLALAAELGRLTGASAVEVVPDLSAATIGEHQLGAGRGVARFVCAAIGTGVNAGAVVDGRLVDTAFGSLGDAGMVLVDPAGPRCPCGGFGCLEAVCSGFALARDGAPFGFPDARSVVAAAGAGHEGAGALVRRAGVALGRAISIWSVVVWPEVVAVAGGVAAGAGDLLLDPARAELSRVGPPYVVAGLRVVPAELGASATLAGAAVLAEAATSA